MTSEKSDYINRQLAIPGMEIPEVTNVRKQTLQQQVAALQERILRLEIEVSLLIIQMEKEHD